MTILQDPKTNALKLSNDLSKMVGEIRDPQQLQATKQYLMNLTNNDPEIKANNLQFIPLGFANSLVNHPMNQPVQGTTKDMIEGKLMASNSQPPGPQNMQPGALNAPPQPPRPGNSGIAALPQSGPQTFKQGGVTRLAGGGDFSTTGLMKQIMDRVSNLNLTNPTNPQDIERQVAASRPDYAQALNQPIGQNLLDTVGEASKERKALLDEQLGPQAERQKQLDLSNSLLAAAEGTRGTGNNLAGLMSGVVAGTSFNNKALAAAEARKNTLKSQAIEAKIADAKLQDLIEERRLAAANNDVAKMIAYDKEIKDLQNQKQTLGISSLTSMLSPAAQLDHARITSAATLAAQDRPTDFIKDARELMKNDSTLSFADAYKMAGKNRGAGAEISANERLQAKYIDALNKIKERYPTLQYYDPSKKNPVMDSAYANYMKEVKELQDQMKAEGGGNINPNPALDTNTPTPGFGPAIVKPK